MREVNKAQTAHEELIPLLCRMVGAKDYLELGMYKGDCIKAVARANPTCKCEGVDRYTYEELFIGKPANAIFTVGDVDTFLADLPADVMFDVVFIDADHSAVAVTDNLLAVWPHVNDQGLVLLHDTFPAGESFTAPGYCGTAYKIAQNLEYAFNRASIGFEAITLPYHPGLTIIRKRTKHLAWEPK